MPIFQNASRSHASNSGTGSFALPGSSHFSFFGDEKIEVAFGAFVFLVAFFGATGAFTAGVVVVVASSKYDDAAKQTQRDTNDEDAFQFG